MTSNQSNVRKTRTINNSIVDIDNVFIGPGDAYVTWIRIAKEKLWQRELALLRQRCEASDVNILTMIMMFVRNQSELFDKSDLNSYALEIIVTRIYQQQLQWQIMNDNSPLIARYMQYIDDLLGKWNGYHPTKKTIDSFREYFQESRGWLDSKKMTKMAHNLWIPMMRLIEEVSRKAASQTFPPQASRLQNACAAYLQTWLILGLVEHQIKPNNCGPKWLIPATVYQTLYTEYHPNVAVNYVCTNAFNLIQMQPADASKKAKIRVCYLRAIGDQIESLQQSFESELSTFYTQSAIATCSQPQPRDAVFAPHLKQPEAVDLRDTYPLNGHNKTVPFAHRQSPNICLNGFGSSDLCAMDPYPGMCDNETRPPPSLFAPLAQSPQDKTDALFTYSEYPLNDSYPVMWNHETSPSPPLFPFCQLPTSELDTSTFQNY